MNAVLAVWEAAVAPHAGAWIETAIMAGFECEATSHPTRVRGLKHYAGFLGIMDTGVAPHAGAWIETTSDSYTYADAARRTPRGCVD